MDIVHVLSIVRDPALVVLVLALGFYIQKNYQSKRDAQILDKRLEDVEKELKDLRKEVVTIPFLQSKLTDIIDPLKDHLNRIEGAINAIRADMHRGSYSKD